METIHQLIIIGSGPAGLTAAIYAARANLKPIVLDGTQPGGQLTGTTAVENWPGEKQILGPTLMINMREQAQALGATFISGSVVELDVSKKPFTLTTSKDTVFKTQALIVATGASPVRLGCPGEDTYWARGVSTCAVCDGAFYKDKKVVIVGGGDTAMEDALFLSKFTSDITIVHIKKALTASYVLAQRVLALPTVHIIYESTVERIEGDGTQVTGVVITNVVTGVTTSVEASGVFIAIGLKPNTQVFKGKLDMNSYGYLLVKDHTKTSVEGVFAAGDVFDDRYRQAITAAGSGCQAALDAQRYLDSLD